MSHKTNEEVTSDARTNLSHTHVYFRGPENRKCQLYGTLAILVGNYKLQVKVKASHAGTPLLYTIIKWLIHVRVLNVQNLSMRLQFYAHTFFNMIIAVILSYLPSFI